MNSSEPHILTIIIAVMLLAGIVVAVLFLYFFLKNKDEVPVSNLDQFQENTYKFMLDAIVILNEENKIIYLNIEAENILGCKLRSVMGKQQQEVFTLLHRETTREIHGLFDELLKSNNVRRECLLSTNENQTYSIDLNLMQSAQNDANSESNNKVLVLRNITERKALESKLSNLETYDPITRMLKRNSFDIEVKQLIENAHKHNSSHILAFFSIDQFQVINDTIGYSGSDKLIEKMSDHIKKHTNNPLDILGRVGSNEYAVVFCERKLPDAIKSMQNILKSVSEYNFLSRGKHYSTTMSAGFVIVDVNTTSSTRAMSEANIACNLASKRGGNRVVAYRAENDEMQKLEGNLEWVMILKKALSENSFRMHAQPIHPLKSEEYKKPFHHYELLLRLSDEKGNPIYPDEFIAAAEYYSMMPDLDRWVIKNVFKHISAIPQQTPLPIFAINLSGQSLNDSQFLDYVKTELKSSSVHPEMLCFEITEQVAVEDLNSINTFISSLKSLGCRFSLDDFGTGVSSFGYLRSLNVDYLKIDGSFVKHIANDDVARTMVQSINQVGHTMDLQIIAEYVENTEIIKILREMGVDYGQGYQIAKPRPIEEVILPHLRNNGSLIKEAS